MHVNVMYSGMSIEGSFLKLLSSNVYCRILKIKLSPNIIAVKYILKISEKLPKDIVFLIIGSVVEAFKGAKVSSNVIFTGYVEEVKSYLIITNVLLNLKFTSNTEIEAKMFDYLSCGKPVISTRIGAVGFEHFPNIIIVDNLRGAVREIVRLYGVEC